ncbi:hypothetical protein [Roseibium sp. SCP14]|uniref:hypothetical protein n=1 Tax=Roseibium sp. SCP14 TaxID=3141375 RepID=UPI003336A72C
MKVCELAVSDPSGYLATLPETGLFGEKVRAEHGDGSLITADIMNGRIWESVVIARVGDKVDIDCHFHFKPPEKTSAKEMAQQFLQILKTKPDWEYVGGYGERDFPSFTGGQSVSKSKAYQYSLFNVWGREDVSVEVTLSKYQVYLGVSAIYRK